MIHINDSKIMRDFIFEIYLDSKKGYMSSKTLAIWDYVLINLLGGNHEMMSLITWSASNVNDIYKYLEITDRVMDGTFIIIQDVVDMLESEKPDIPVEVDPEKEMLKEKIEMLDGAVSDLMMLIQTM